jgi:hypothetical protein
MKELAQISQRITNDRMLKKLIILSGCLVLAIYGAYGQTTSCSQTLRLARSTYDQGRLHELPDLLKNCLANGFTKEDKVTALRLLTLSYIYLEEPEQADESMRLLLETDNYFAPNDAVDPAEFIALYKTFRTTPIYGLGFKVGPNVTFPSVLDNYYVGNASPGDGKYKQKIGFQFGLLFEKDFFANSKSKFLKKITFSPEALFTTRSFTYNSPAVFLNDSIDVVNGATEPATVAHSEITYKQTWMDINLLLQYKVRNNKINPYVGIGPAFSYLLSGSNTQVFTPEAGNTVSGPDVILKDSYNKIVYSVITVAGVKYRLGSFYITGEIRFQYGISNVVNPKTRSNSENVFDYASQLNDFRQSNTAINFGIMYPIFKPKKL